MATTTPNFGWAVPTSSDLVKNGATAIETLGDSIDASLVDLKGGTTGQVLAKTSATDMDFTWTTASGGSSNVAGKNGVLNSNFSVWQRGTSFTSAGFVYTADRWQFYPQGASNRDVSRQSAGSTLPTIQYCSRIGRQSGNTATTAMYFGQNFESVQSYQFAGQAVTVSFYARKGANYSATSDVLSFGLFSGTGTDQNVFSGYTGQATVLNQNATLTTSWQRFSFTGTVASTATELAMYFVYTPTGTAGAADYFEVTGVQLEIAASASAYSPNTSNYALELAACQRYYWRFTATAGGANYLCLGRTTSQVDVEIQHPVQMRTSPTALEYGGTTDVSDINVAGYNTTSLSFANASVLFASIRANTQASLAQGKTYVFGVQTSAYYGFSAEL